MKLSLNWIKKYVDLPAGLTKSKLAYDLTMCTVEVESAVDLAEGFAGIVVGKIISVQPHPDADKLRVCTVDIGESEPSVIVCGGCNLADGQHVVVAKPGSFVRWHGEGEPVEIKPAKLRGVMSSGMICASGEIGLDELFPASLPNEIIDLIGHDVRPGQPVPEALGIDDIILEIDNKSLTNRPDLWGHYGLARELAAIYNCPLKPIPPVSLPTDSDGLEIVIENPELCARYAGVVIQNIKNVSSPFWLRTMLWRVGQRPINLPVDITNYVMFATGQPTHAFDRTHIHGAINIRMSRPGEKLELLDGTYLDLTTEDMVIADGKNPVALAGIKGGKQDSILPETTEVILEVANFSAMGIRRTAQRFDLRTEASSRYEKGADPQRVTDGVMLAIAMFRSEFPEAEISGYVDNYPAPLPPAEVDVSLDFLSRRLGKEISGEEAKNKLEHLGFAVKIEDGLLRVVAPAWRSTGDITLPDDILEEIARLMGYENFEFKAPTIILEQPVNQILPEFERALREYLAFRCGMQEIFTYPWIGDEYINVAGVDKTEMLQLSTPPAPDETHLRSTLIPGLLKTVCANLRYFAEFRIYEMTQVFFDKNYAAINSPTELLPEQKLSLGGAFVGTDAMKLFREAKGVLEVMHRIVRMEPLSFTQAVRPTWTDDKLWINVTRAGEVVGVIGLVSMKAAREVGIKRSLAVIFELDVDKLIPLGSRNNVFERLPEYPLVNFDLSIAFDESVKWSDIRETATKASLLVREVRFIDEYRGAQTGAGKKSISFRTWIGSEDGTLTSEKIEEVTNQIVKKIGKKFGGNVRGA